MKKSFGLRNKRIEKDVLRTITFQVIMFEKMTIKTVDYSQVHRTSSLTSTPSRVLTPSEHLRKTKASTDWYSLFFWWIFRGSTACFAGCVLGSRIGRLRTVDYSQVRRTSSFTSTPYGFSPLQNYSTKNKMRRSKDHLIFFWWIFRGSNPGHPD